MALAINFANVELARSFSIERFDGEEQELALLRMTPEGQIGLQEDRILPRAAFNVKASEELMDLVGIDVIPCCTPYIFARAFDNSSSGKFKLADLSVTVTQLPNRDVPSGIHKPDSPEFQAPTGSYYVHSVKNDRGQVISTLYGLTEVQTKGRTAQVWTEVNTRVEIARMAYVGDMPEEDRAYYRGTPRNTIAQDYSSIELRPEQVNGKDWFVLVGIA